VVWAALMLGLWPGASTGADLESFRQQKVLTPESFIRQFADFNYELRNKVQEPESFLTRRTGDCDDFSRVAALLLGERGYQTKVVVVMMERETHVVCHVPEVGGFLDFNHRKRNSPVVASDGSLEDIARKVSGDFRSRWRMASEVRYKGATAVFVNSVFYYPSAPADKHPVTVDAEAEPAVGEQTEIAAGAASPVQTTR
jgi:hypothetical protein